MASRILLNSAQEIDATLYTGYIALVIRGTGLVRDTGVQNISGQKFFYDTITFYSGLNVTGDFVPSGDVAGNLTPKTNNLYDLGSVSKEWRNAYFDGFVRTDTLHVDENANITGNLFVSGNVTGSGSVYFAGTATIVGNSQLGNTTITGDFSPNNFATSFIPKTDNLYDIGSSSNEVRNIFVDGTGRIDSLYVDENAFVSGGISGASVSSSGLATFGSLIVTGSGIPATPTSVGNFGQIIIGSGYLYACTGTNRWGRTHLTGWI